METFNINNYLNKGRQIELFDSKISTSAYLEHSNNLKIDREAIIEWRKKIYHHQSKIMEDNKKTIIQTSILPNNTCFDEKKCNLSLTL